MRSPIGSVSSLHSGITTVKTCVFSVQFNITKDMPILKMDSSENNELLNRPLVNEDVSDTDTIVNENDNQMSTDE